MDELKFNNGPVQGASLRREKGSELMPTAVEQHRTAHFLLIQRASIPGRIPTYLATSQNVPVITLHREALAVNFVVFPGLQNTYQDQFFTIVYHVLAAPSPRDQP